MKEKKQRDISPSRVRRDHNQVPISPQPISINVKGCNLETTYTISQFLAYTERFSIASDELG